MNNVAMEELCRNNVAMENGAKDLRRNIVATVARGAVKRRMLDQRRRSYHRNLSFVAMAAAKLLLPAM